jgi:hypothetical protein
MRVARGAFVIWSTVGATKHIIIKYKMPSQADKENQPVQLRFAKLTENAFTPTRGSALAAGYDLCR